MYVLTSLVAFGEHDFTNREGWERTHRRAGDASTLQTMSNIECCLCCPFQLQFTPLQRCQSAAPSSRKWRFLFNGDGRLGYRRSGLHCNFFFRVHAAGCNRSLRLRWKSHNPCGVNPAEIAKLVEDVFTFVSLSFNSSNRTLHESWARDPKLGELKCKILLMHTSSCYMPNDQCKTHSLTNNPSLAKCTTLIDIITCEVLNITYATTHIYMLGDLRIYNSYWTRLLMIRCNVPEQILLAPKSCYLPMQRLVPYFNNAWSSSLCFGGVSQRAVCC